MNMPVLPIDAMVLDCNDLEERIVRAAFTVRGVSGGYGRLRANKPFRTVESFTQGCANYVWRMLCFDLVGWGKHACMPVCADFELSEAIEHRDGKRYRYGEPGYEEQRAEKRDLMKRMDALVSAVEKALPPESMKGVIRWGRALGMIG